MKIRTFITALVLAGSLTACVSSSASFEEVEHPGITVIPTSELFDVEDSPVLEEEDIPSQSVPEPAMFGLITMALAVGGGLMVRRKAD